MSFDLYVHVAHPVTAQGLQDALGKRKCMLAADLDYPLDEHSGGLPLRITWRKEDHDECPEFGVHDGVEMDELEECPRRLRGKIAAARRVYSLSGNDAPGCWALAAALCVAGDGICVDPQEGEYFSASAAWKKFATRCRETYASVSSVAGKSPEERFVEKLKKRYPRMAPSQIEKELGWWREEQRKKRGSKVLQPLIDDSTAASLQRFLREAPPSQDDLEDLLLAANRAKDAEKGRILVESADQDALVALAHKFFYTVGVSSRIFVEFLIEAGLAGRLPESAHEALLARCTDKDIRQSVSAGFESTSD